MNVPNIVINWKTSSAGMAAILTAVADLLNAYVHKTVPNWGADMPAIIVGLGLIFSKDHDK